MPKPCFFRASSFTFRLPAFAYDATRTAATTVAPYTDILAALRTAQHLRALLATSAA